VSPAAPLAFFVPRMTEAILLGAVKPRSKGSNRNTAYLTREFQLFIETTTQTLAPTTTNRRGKALPKLRYENLSDSDILIVQNKFADKFGEAKRILCSQDIIKHIALCGPVEAAPRKKRIVSVEDQAKNEEKKIEKKAEIVAIAARKDDALARRKAKEKEAKDLSNATEAEQTRLIQEANQLVQKCNRYIIQGFLLDTELPEAEILWKAFSPLIDGLNSHYTTSSCSASHLTIFQLRDSFFNLCASAEFTSAYRNLLQNRQQGSSQFSRLSLTSNSTNTTTTNNTTNAATTTNNNNASDKKSILQHTRFLRDRKDKLSGLLRSISTEQDERAKKRKTEDDKTEAKSSRRRVEQTRTDPLPSGEMDRTLKDLDIEIKEQFNILTEKLQERKLLLINNHHSRAPKAQTFYYAQIVDDPAHGNDSLFYPPHFHAREQEDLQSIHNIINAGFKPLAVASSVTKKEKTSYTIYTSK